MAQQDSRFQKMVPTLGRLLLPTDRETVSVFGASGFLFLTVVPPRAPGFDPEARGAETASRDNRWYSA
jgi:hypothetical protein